MNTNKSAQIERMITFLEGMEKHKQSLIEIKRFWLDDNFYLDQDREIYDVEKEIIKGYELLALYGAAKKDKDLALMDVASRGFIMRNWLLVPSQTFIKSFKSIFYL